MLKMIFCTALAGVVLTGCASFCTEMINANGVLKRCESSGGGFGLGAIVGAGSAAVMRSNCVSNYSDAGYLEFNEAGSLRVHAERQEQGFYIKKSYVDEVVEGDVITSINGQLPDDFSGFKKIIFGKLSEDLSLTIVRDGKELKQLIKRVPFHRN